MTPAGQRSKGEWRDPIWRALNQAIYFAVFFACSGLVPLLARASNAPESPEIRIRSPFAGPIWRLDADDDERFVVLSNAYKAISIWGLADARGPTYLRTPLRNDQQKRAHGIAISPDGELIAYSSPPLTEPSGAIRAGTSVIVVVARATGHIVNVINDVPTRPQVLRFSHDGKYLAAGLSSGCGLRLWSVNDWKLFAQDDRGYAGDQEIENGCCPGGKGIECEDLPQTNAVLFTPEGSTTWLVTSSDTGLRAYRKSASGIELLVHRLPKEIGLERPGGAAISPDGRAIAVGDRRDRSIPEPQPELDLVRFRVGIVELEGLTPKRQPLEIAETALFHIGYLDRRQNISINQASLDRVAWIKAHDHEYIFAAGAFPCEAARPDLRPLADPNLRKTQCLARWVADREGGDPLFIPVGIDRVIDLIALPRHDGLLYASHRQVEAIDFLGNPLELPSGKVLLERNSAADFHDASLDFKISPDARSVTFKDYRSVAGTTLTLTFDLRGPTLVEGINDGRATLTPNQDENIVRDWKDSERSPPVLNDERLSGPEFHISETYRSVAVLPAKSVALIGSSEFLKLVSFDEGRSRVLCQQPIREEAYRVNLTNDGTMAVAGHSDGTLRWYRIHPRGERCQFELLLSVYLAQTSSGQWAWVAWRPSGVFANHPAAKGLLEWQSTDNNGQVVITPFRNLIQWYREDEIRNSLDGSAGDKNEEEVKRDQIANSATIFEAGERNLLHVLREPENNDTTDESVRFRVAINDDGKWPKNMDIRIGEDNAPVEKLFGTNKIPASAPLVISKADLDESVAEFSITLPNSARRYQRNIQICFYLDHVYQTCHSIAWLGKVTEPRKPRLWAVFVGFSRYDAPELNLSYSVNDVVDVARIFIQDYDNRFEKAKSRTPLDFREIHIDLAVSPLSSSSEREIVALEQHSYVTRLSPTRDGIFWQPYHGLLSLQKVMIYCYSIFLATAWYIQKREHEGGQFLQRQLLLLNFRWRTSTKQVSLATSLFSF